MNTETFFAALWDDYTRLAPQAVAIRDLFGGAAVQNDHVAFRTFNHPLISITVLEQPLLELGYRRHAAYQFPEKHLSAWSYVPAKRTDPFIFLSQLHIEQLPLPVQQILTQLLSSLPVPCVTGPEVFWAARLWPAPTQAQFQMLAEQSEYAAWLAIHGFHANHFTIAVHSLGVSLSDVVSRLNAAGYPLNHAGGLIKGSEEELLMQASTMAQEVNVDFADVSHQAVPGCYYEFAQRFCDADGQLYQGFVAASANRIFESTNFVK